MLLCTINSFSWNNFFTTLGALSLNMFLENSSLLPEAGFLDHFQQGCFINMLGYTRSKCCH